MTVEDNIGLVKRLYKATNDRDWNTVFALHSKEHLRFDVDKPEPMKGLELYRIYIVGFADAFPDFHIEVVRAFGQDNMVCDEHITSGTHSGPMKSLDGKTVPPSGKSFKVRNCHIYKIENGKIMETWRYLDQLIFLSQLDLLPKR